MDRSSHWGFKSPPMSNYRYRWQITAKIITVTVWRRAKSQSLGACAVSSSCPLTNKHINIRMYTHVHWYCLKTIGMFICQNVFLLCCLSLHTHTYSVEEEGFWGQDLGLYLIWLGLAENPSFPWWQNASEFPMMTECFLKERETACGGGYCGSLQATGRIMEINHLMWPRSAVGSR